MLPLISVLSVTTFCMFVREFSSLREQGVRNEDFLWAAGVDLSRDCCALGTTGFSPAQTCPGAWVCRPPPRTPTLHSQMHSNPSERNTNFTSRLTHWCVSGPCPTRGPECKLLQIKKM